MLSVFEAVSSTHAFTQMDSDEPSTGAEWDVIWKIWHDDGVLHPPPDQMNSGSLWNQRWWFSSLRMTSRETLARSGSVHFTHWHMKLNYYRSTTFRHLIMISIFTPTVSVTLYSAKNMNLAIVLVVFL